MASKPLQQKDIQFAILATDVVVFRMINNQLCVLLGRVNVEPHYINQWGLIGGLITATETADESVERHLKVKAGITDIYKEQLYTFSHVKRDPRGRVVSVAYIALAGSDPQNGKGSIETKWQPVKELPSLAYDHMSIIEAAYERLQARIGYTNIVQYLLPEHFTFGELQKTYEIVLGRELDKRNFRKKIMAADILKDTKLTKQEGIMRPASLFAFNSKKIKVVEIL